MSSFPRLSDNLRGRIRLCALPFLTPVGEEQVVLLVLHDGDLGSGDGLPVSVGLKTSEISTMLL